MKYEFVSVGRVVFGRGEGKRVGEIVRSLGKRALVVHNGRGVERVMGEGVMFRQKGEPTVADVDRGVEMAKREGCDVVVGYGGGSSMDLAKAVAGVAGNGGSVTDYMEVVGKGMKITKALPWVAVPTTAGTGAEVTRNAVIGWPEKKFKSSVRSDVLLARVAVVDPELGMDVPAGVTAMSGMDALAQCIESYVSKNANAMTDGLAIQGMRLAARWLVRAVENGKDVEARAGMAQAAMMSGMTLTNAGLGAVHGFAAPLGGNFPVPHGVVCAALLPGVIGANLAGARERGLKDVLRKYVDVGRALAGEPMMGEEAALATCEAFAAGLVRDLKVPGLKEFGVREERVDEMVEMAKRSSSMKYNPVELSDEVLRGVLREGIG